MRPQISFTVDVVLPGWLFARTCRLLDRAAVVVYRSAWLDDDSEMYVEVRSALNGRFELVLREEVPDTSMVFGAGELSVHVDQAETISHTELERLKQQAYEVIEHQRAS